jgi:hypothetical protein
VQGLEPCTGCLDTCYQCGKRGIQAGEDAALAWDSGEIYGLSDPTRLPSPTTASLARTVIMRPERGTITQLHILDAERAQGMQEEHTSLTRGQSEKHIPKKILELRFRCVGNALPGLVRFVLATIIATCRAVADASRDHTPHLLQMLGELFNRMRHVRDFTSRLAATDCTRLPPALQPGGVLITAPDSPFPRAGFYKDGKYWQVKRCCGGNLVNVRLHLWPYRLH